MTLLATYPQPHKFRLIITAALTFQDRAAAQELLCGLKANRLVFMAVVYSKDGEVFASYFRDPSRRVVIPPMRPDAVRFEQGN
jgi:hypothetical protein